MDKENKQNEKSCYWMRDIRSQTIHEMHVTFHEFQRKIGTEVQNTGVFQGQHKVLMMLYRNPDITQVSMAGKLNISPAAVATILKKLEQGGYIERHSQEEDKRANEIHLTDKGNEIVEKSLAIFNKVDSLAFNGFSDEEIEQLKAYLNRVSKNLRE